jgi:hypothetical protein
MFDSDEGYSSDILVTLEQTGTGCRYTLTPDREWLEDTERVYPVTLDPQVTTTQNTNYIHDNGVQQSDPNTNYITADRMYVGSGPNSTQGRIYFKLTQWPSATNLTAASITNARLNLNYYPQSSWQTAYQMTIDVYRVSSSWNTNTITWNNQTGIGGTWISSKYISNSRNKTSGYDTFDVTSWVKSHYSSPSTDYGIRLQPRTVVGSTNRACYISSDYYANTSLRPIIYIDYNAYNLYFKQYYDTAYASRYGSTSSTDIAAYTKIVSDYYFNVFGIKINSTLSTYKSPADSCTHKSTYNASCTRRLTGKCDYYNGPYHCTNNAAALFTKPSGVSTIANNTKIIKWTGHINCENCAVGSSHANIGSVTDGTQVLIHWGNSLTSSTRKKVSVGSIAHEIGHALGCQGDNSGTCSSNVCIMKYGVSDDTKLANLQSYSINAYCSVCRAKIQNYANTYLR